MKELKEFTLEELIYAEKMADIICKRYENLAEMNRHYTSTTDIYDFQKATNSFSFFNGKRDKIIEEMEKRIREIE